MFKWLRNILFTGDSSEKPISQAPTPGSDSLEGKLASRPELVSPVTAEDILEASTYKTTIYELESLPGQKVEVLAEYEDIAVRLIHDALNKEPFDALVEYPFLNTDNGFPCLRETMGLHSARISHGRETLFKDRTYIAVAIYGAKKEGLDQMENNLQEVLGELSRI